VFFIDDNRIAVINLWYILLHMERGMVPK
jgi:hypothetical protein